MAKPIPYDIRVKIVERIRSKESIKEISQDFGYSIAGVRKIWRQFQKEGDSAFHTNYSNCGAKPIYGQKVKDFVTLLRDNRQGANYIYSKMLIKAPDLPTPTPRTIQRWWVKEQTNRCQGRVTKEEKKLGVQKLIKLGK